MAVKGARARLHALLKEGRAVLKAGDLDHTAQESGGPLPPQELERRLPTMQGRAVAVFSCTRHGLWEELILPRRVHDPNFLRCHAICPPLAGGGREEFPRYCVAVVDQALAWFYEFHMGPLDEASKVTDQKLRKPDFADRHGLEEYRVQNRAGELLHRHLRHTAADVGRLVESTAAQLLIVGGHEGIVLRFLPFLSLPLRERLAGTFVVDPHNMTPGRIRQLADEVAGSYERDVGAPLRRARLGPGGDGWPGGGGTVVVPDGVQRKGNSGAAGPRLRRGIRTGVRYLWMVGIGRRHLAVCGRLTRAAPDIINEMAAAVVDASGTVKQVYADTPLSSRPVAAFLRFPVERPAG